jgi:hypothetical protein
MNVLKKRNTNAIMSMMIAYLNDKIDHDELMSKLNEQISFHELDRQPDQSPLPTRPMPTLLESHRQP